MSYQADHLAWQQRVMIELNSASKFLENTSFYPKSKPQLFKPDGTYNHPTGTSHDFGKVEDEFTRTFQASRGARKLGAGRNQLNDFYHSQSGPFSPQNAVLKQKMVSVLSIQLRTPKRDNYVGASKNFPKQHMEQLSRRLHPTGSLSSVTSRPGTKRGRFNEDLSQHIGAPRLGTSSSVVSNRLKAARSLSKQHSQVAASEFYRPHFKRSAVGRDDARSEKAESIKSRIIEAISRMDDGQIEKLKTVLRLDNQEAAEITEENLKKLDEIYKIDEPDEVEPLAGPPDFGEQQNQQAQGDQLDYQASEKSLSHFRAKIPSIRSKHPLSIRSGFSNRTQPSVISALEIQLREERKAREKLQSELQELKKISREISHRQK